MKGYVIYVVWGDGLVKIIVAETSNWAISWFLWFHKGTQRLDPYLTHAPPIIYIIYI
jgi:hypothetical protein